MLYAIRLRLFVEDSRVAGRSRSQVLAALRRFGWTDDEIDLAFDGWGEGDAAAVTA